MVILMKSALDSRVMASFPMLGLVKWNLPKRAEGFLFNVIGARTRQSYLSVGWYDEVNTIDFNEELLEWVTIVETIMASEDRYVMADVGAGYGRWLVNAAILARRFGRTPFVIGLEAEDTHFSWMSEHLIDNHISSTQYRIIHAPIAGTRRDVAFTFGHARDWYGQSVLPAKEVGFGNWPEAHVETRRSLLLEDIIGDIPIIDLLDLDIQGMEMEVILSSIKLIGERVKRIYIGTHSRKIEDDLRRLMIDTGWLPRFDCPCGSPGYLLLVVRLTLKTECRVG